MNISYTKKTHLSFEQTCKRIRSLLPEEGFGVLCSIPVHNTLKKKLGVTLNKYIILGVCHPPSAYKILQEDKEIGLLLPCNIIIYEQGEGSNVSCILPTSLMKTSTNTVVGEIAAEIEEKLITILDKI